MAHLDDFRACIDACNLCVGACDRGAAACLAAPNVQELNRSIALAIDCAAICRLAAGFMSRDSEFALLVCAACAEVCDACARECEGQARMEHCQQCGAACRRCAEECRRVGVVPRAWRPGEAGGTTT